MDSISTLVVVFYRQESVSGTNLCVFGIKMLLPRMTIDYSDPVKLSTEVFSVDHYT